MICGKFVPDGSDPPVLGQRRSVYLMVYFCTECMTEPIDEDGDQC